MAEPFVRVLLSPGPVSLDEEARRLAELASPLGAGSFVAFMGFVKGLVDGRRVEFLEYEAVEDLALAKMREIAEWAVGQGRVYAVEIIHRIGRLRPGEPTIYVIVVAEPRHLAFKLASEILDRVKREVPVYKLEGREDGEYWILGEHNRIPRGGEEGPH